MPIIQFLSGFAISVLSWWIGGQMMKNVLMARLANHINTQLDVAIKAQNIGGDADEHLRLEGEIRAYQKFLE